MLTAAGRTSSASGPTIIARRGVDAVAGRDVARVGDEVRGRVAERAAALVAVDDLAAQLERLAEQPAGLLDVAGEHAGPRMWLEETTSPSNSSSGWTRVSKRSSAREHLRVALALWPKRKFSPTDDVRGLEHLDEHVVDEVLGRARGERAVERDDHELLDAEAGDELGLALDRRQQPRRRAGRDDRLRVRIERQDGVGAAR